MLQRNGLAPKDPVAPVKQAIEQSAGDLMIVSHLPFLGKLAALLVADNEETEIVAFRSAASCVSSALRMARGTWRGRLCERFSAHRPKAFMRLGGVMIAEEAPGRSRGKPRSISDPQQVLPLAKVALEAHALGNLEARDDAPLDLLAGLSGRFARSPIFPPGLIEVRDKSVALDGRRLK